MTGQEQSNEKRVGWSIYCTYYILDYTAHKKGLQYQPIKPSLFMHGIFYLRTNLPQKKNNHSRI